MKTAKLIILFLVINFGCLALGSWLMDNGPQSQWYLNLNKAPWTPPGWVFGVAWSTIMICFSVYLAYLFKDFQSQFVKILFSIQIILNVSWNYVFFNQHLVFLGLVIISLLTLVIGYFYIKYQLDYMKRMRYLLLPYLIWLLLATSLNTYIFINN
ncbi:TspO [Mangrovimonas yunxiaonensis]|uniref:TspO n=2 Tax=Mangrovimonas TaxID=1211036 RepID=A0A084TJD7_9FLAO|nr:MULTISPECIES: TspO/MBR family protein [Mangrovimonas]KFB00823.1 TspO [Mangrovimonas yunxiaonensis]RSK40386.1 tryptophan-rich sensory protein [Mangrovimonas spongiae]GGH44216.1 sensory protein TspO [Mangrovimonas yunxiaonensis]